MLGAQRLCPCILPTSHRTQLGTDVPKYGSNVHLLRSAPTQRDHPTSHGWQAPLPVPVHLLIQSSSPRQQVSLQRAQQSCEHRPQHCQPMALSITIPFLLFLLFLLKLKLFCVPPPLPVPRTVPSQLQTMCSRVQHTIMLCCHKTSSPSSLAGSTRKEGSSTTRDSPTQPAPGIAQFSHHLQTLGEKAAKH